MTRRSEQNVRPIVEIQTVGYSSIGNKIPVPRHQVEISIHIP